MKIIGEITKASKNNQNRGFSLMNQYGAIMGLITQNCQNSLDLYDQIMELQDELLRIKVKNSELEEEVERLNKSSQENEESLKYNQDQVSLLK